MKLFMRVFLGLAILGLTLPNLVWADPPAAEGEAAAEANDKLSQILAQNLYCDTKDLLEGNLGLIAGLFLVFLGLFGLIQGKKIYAVLPIIFIGSIITALPSLVESTFTGLGGLLTETNISTKAFSPPTCTATTTTSTPPPSSSAPKSPGYGVYMPMSPAGITNPSIYACKEGDTRTDCK